MSTTFYPTISLNSINANFLNSSHAKQRVEMMYNINIRIHARLFTSKKNEIKKKGFKTKFLVSFFKTFFFSFDVHSKEGGGARTKNRQVENIEEECFLKKIVHFIAFHIFPICQRVTCSTKIIYFVQENHWQVNFPKINSNLFLRRQFYYLVEKRPFTGIFFNIFRIFFFFNLNNYSFYFIMHFSLVNYFLYWKKKFIVYFIKKIFILEKKF